MRRNQSIKIKALRAFMTLVSFLEYHDFLGFHRKTESHKLTNSREYKKMVGYCEFGSRSYLMIGLALFIFYFYI
jgi:hypothetical protein